MKSKRNTILIMLALLICISLTGPAMADMAMGPVEPCFSAIPISDEPNGAYLERVIMNITFSGDQIGVNENYTFRNDQEAHSIKVVLPFREKPEALKVYCNFKEIAYQWLELDEVADDFQSGLQADLTDFKQVLVFEIPLSKGDNNEKDRTVNVFYRRKCQANSFSYCIATAKAWKHPIKEVIYSFNISREKFTGELEFVAENFRIQTKYGKNTLEEMNYNGQGLYHISFEDKVVRMTVSNKQVRYQNNYPVRFRWE